MAHFYGRITSMSTTGRRRVSARGKTGGREAPMIVIASSREGAVQVTLRHIDGIDIATVELIPWAFHGDASGISRELYHGPVSGEGLPENVAEVPIHVTEQNISDMIARQCHIPPSLLAHRPMPVMADTVHTPHVSIDAAAVSAAPESAARPPAVMSSCRCPRCGSSALGERQYCGPCSNYLATVTHIGNEGP